MDTRLAPGGGALELSAVGERRLTAGGLVGQEVQQLDGGRPRVGGEVGVRLQLGRRVGDAVAGGVGAHVVDAFEGDLADVTDPAG